MKVERMGYFACLFDFFNELKIMARGRMGVQLFCFFVCLLCFLFINISTKKVGHCA